MSATTFITRRMTEIRQGSRAVLARKMKRALRFPLKLPLYIIAVPVVLMTRLIRPWLLVRWEYLMSQRIGHFAANTELYLCEQEAGINVPGQPYVDLFCMGSQAYCNEQLAIMWKRVLRVWPYLILSPINRVNRLIPGGMVHEIGNNTHGALDIHNLLDRFPPHLKFTPEEEARGEEGLRAMGIPPETSFICLIVRDSAYLDTHQPGDWSYHSHRDCNIQNYILAAEELAERGYFVVRMGAKVKDAMKTYHPRVIDYATNGMRSDFMDIFLGARCSFCISTATGWDAIPEIFRRPIVYVNAVPLGYLNTSRKEILFLTKKHIDRKDGRSLTLREIFTRDVGFSLTTSGYESKGIELIENTSEEIRDVAIEMAERLSGAWQPHKDDEALQRRFWEIFPTDAVDPYQGRPLHGEIPSRFGAAFLRNNREWLE